MNKLSREVICPPFSFWQKAMIVISYLLIASALTIGLDRLLNYISYTQTENQEDLTLDINYHVCRQIDLQELTITLK